MDNYRLEREANLIRKFTSINKTYNVSSKENLTVPVPEILHVENNTKDIGFTISNNNSWLGVLSSH